MFIYLASLTCWNVFLFFYSLQFFPRWSNREQLCFQTSKWKLCIISWTKRCCRIVSTYIRGRINYIAKKRKIYTDVIYRESHLKVLIIFTQSKSVREGWLQILLKDLLHGLLVIIWISVKGNLSIRRKAQLCLTGPDCLCSLDCK